MGLKNQIAYPENTNPDLCYRGRNGYGKKILGVDIMLLNAQSGPGKAFVMMNPINGKGDMTDSCRIDTPADPATLRRFAAKFEEMATEMEAIIAAEGEEDDSLSCPDCKREVGEEEVVCTECGAELTIP